MGQGFGQMWFFSPNIHAMPLLQHSHPFIQNDSIQQDEKENPIIDRGYES